MSATLNPTLAGAVTKAERGIAFLRIPGATSDHLRSAMDCLKSAQRLAASHHTVLVELEDQVPEPGPALFDATGGPAPGAALVTSDDVILAMDGAEFRSLPWNHEEEAIEDLWFAVRSHFRARQLPVERFRALKGLVEEALGGFGDDTWNWMIEQVKTSGEFVWPYLCPICDKIREPKEDLCSSCEHEARQKAYKAEQDAKKAAKRAEKKASKPTPKPRTNPLSAPPEAEGEA